jgi:sodium-coupled neutral amino acid transporter 11
MTTYYFPDEPFHPTRHLYFTTVLVLISMFLSLVTCDLGAVFELIGATSAAALAYILPPLCYVKLSNTSHRAKLPAYACIVFGTVVMVISLFQAVGKMIRSECSIRFSHQAHAVSLTLFSLPTDEGGAQTCGGAI